MRALLIIAFAGGGVVACGSPKPPPLPAGPPAALEAQRAAPDDVVVAQVDGKPVWGSCVAVQAAREHTTREVALRECIDFELMAHAAEQRGFATHPEVVAATHTALVSKVVEIAYEDGFQRPEDFGAFWNLVLQRTKLQFKYKHVEYRASTYVRIPVKDPKADDPQAHALADRIAAAVAGERGLLGPQLVAIAERIVHLVPCEPDKYVPCTQDVPLYKLGGLSDGAYEDALFALPEVGRATEAVRTSLGWDVIAWTDVEPATSPSDDELVRLELPDVKQAYFQARYVWSRAGNGDIAKALGVHVELDPHADALLEALP